MGAYLIVGFISMIPITLMLLEKAKDQTRESIKFRNDLLSFSYLIKDLGPNVTAFSVVSLFTSTSEANKVLITVAFVGIGLHFLGRKLRDYIYGFSTRKEHKLKTFAKLRKK